MYISCGEFIVFRLSTPRGRAEPSRSVPTHLRFTAIPSMTRARAPIQLSPRLGWAVLGSLYGKSLYMLFYPCIGPAGSTDCGLNRLLYGQFTGRSWNCRALYCIVFRYWFLLLYWLPLVINHTPCMYLYAIICFLLVKKGFDSNKDRRIIWLVIHLRPTYIHTYISTILIYLIIN